MGASGLEVVKVEGNVSLTGAEAALGLAVAGLGIARLPAFMAREAVRAGRLQTLLPDHPVRGLFNTLHAFSPPDRQGNPKARALIDPPLEHRDVFPASLSDFCCR